MAQYLGASQSSQNLRASYAYPSHRLPSSVSSASLLLPHSTSFQSFGHGSKARSSGTWTTSSGELGLLNNADEVEDRDVFVQEYNRLAKKGDAERCPEKRGWISRLLRSNPNRCPHAPPKSPPPPPPLIRHRRSVSEFANIIHCRREVPRVIDIQDMVRLGGKSILYLPQEYSPCSLILPTCIRANAQYLAQNVATRGLFRVPGSAKAITALFDYYCYMDNSNAKIASTVRCATLPIHIQYSIHDVASTFKRLLSVLPGGVLGSLSLFDAFIAIHSQLNGEPEYPRTKQTKVRARLIALAVGTVRSQYRRELICAVFGLLSLIGRAAEIAPREDEDSRPLPTADLMGYSALGIVFGPLLVGDLLEQYTMKIATPNSGMLLFPLSPPRFRKDRRKSIQKDAKTAGPPTVDKILVANDITQMLISNWRDVVRQMKSLGTHGRKDASTIDLCGKQETSQRATSFSIKVPKDFDEDHSGLPNLHAREPRHEPETPTHGPRPRRLKVLRRANSQRLLPKMSIATLSPTKEESLGDDEFSDRQRKRESVIDRLQKLEKNGDQSREGNDGVGDPQARLQSQEFNEGNFVKGATRVASSKGAEENAENPTTGASQVYLESVPPRESSRQSSLHDDSHHGLSQHALSEITMSTLDPMRKEKMTNSDSQAQARDSDGKLSSSDQADIIKETSRRSDEFLSVSKNTKPLSEGGIRIVQASPKPRGLVRGPPKPDEDQVSLEPHMTPKPFTSHDRAIQCQIITAEPERRYSIDTTPERFYPLSQISQATRPVTPDKGLLGQRRVIKSQKQPVLLHGPRLSKSHENLRSQTFITLQSPTESAESKELSKKGSVKATAALFELQTGWRESDTRMGSRSQSRRRHSKSDSAWTQSLDPLMDLDHDFLRMNENPQHISSGRDTFTPIKRDDNDKPDGKELKPVPSLGTMTPCPEPPPVAQHLNLARPPSSPSRMMDVEPYSASDMVSTSQVSRAGSVTVLYSQIRKLQRQLNAKTEEAAQLRRQLEAQQDSDIGTMSEQLRQAKRDVAAWKDRAETAERRVKVFEKFTERLKEIRHAMAETTPRKLGVGGPSTAGQRDAKLGDNENSADVIEALKLVQESRDNFQGKECPSARPTQAQKPLHELAKTQDGAFSPASGSFAEEGLSCGSPCVCQRSGQMWAVAEEFLQMEDERRTRGT
ncbi:hypothetical protein EsDP_00007154 [Epichloe bromicola]|uniref:Rho-GAP domain-containing protein n=1 Tax=Epichloe bromicola TaxID=79588 RepID=A0ABQ0CZQ3_9HYPO